MTSTVSVVVKTTRRASPVQNAAVPTASPRGILTRAAYRSGGGTAGRSSARRSCRSSQWLVKFERQRRRGARVDGVFLSQLHRPPRTELRRHLTPMALTIRRARIYHRASVDATMRFAPSKMVRARTVASFAMWLFERPTSVYDAHPTASL